MASSRMCREIPYQNFLKIKQTVLGKRTDEGTVADGNLFVDPSFPPDLTSLTYVYSGDDRYERTIFKRPKEICSEPIFIGVGGLWEVPFPWRHWYKKSWFEAAVVIVSLSIHFLDKLIPGYKSFEQSFQNDYIGSFRFNIWRFGEWIEIVVDDNLPILDNKLMYCRMLGYPPEFWGLLLEKVYAKCKKTYEGIECGNTLDALTDLTASVCEFYTPDVNPPGNLFHMLYKCSVNRSMIICWRNDKLLTPNGFKPFDDNKINQDQTRFLHIVTATTKFPRTDGRMLEMLRIKCPYPEEPKWDGNFSDRDTLSWNSLNAEFVERFRPHSNKDKDEYWISMEDFRCNFGGLIICTSCDPFRIEGFNVDRMYLLSINLVNNSSSNTREPKKHNTSADHKESHVLYEKHKSSYKLPHPNIRRHQSFSECSIKNKGFDIAVQENGMTIRSTTATTSVNKHCVKTADVRCDDKCDSSENIVTLFAHENNSKNIKWGLGDTKRSVFSAGATSKNETADDDTIRKYKRVASVLSNASIMSESESTFSASDININVREHPSVSQNKSGSRSKSALLVTNVKTPGIVTGYTKINFMASKTDHFRSHASWKMIVEHCGVWARNCSAGSNVESDVDYVNPRIPFTISRPDATNPVIPQHLHGKSHVLISVLQDYRHGPSTTNSLLVQIGFCLYKSKHPEKDKLRHVSKLQMIGQVDSEVNMREVNGRFDLDPGNYLVVPYCQKRCHEGEFLIRILGEKNPIAAKTGCSVS